MTSWAGMSSVTVRRSIFCMRSMKGTSKMRPGPRGPRSRPRRKTTPRSYSLTTLIADASTIRMMSRIGTMTNKDQLMGSTPTCTSIARNTRFRQFSRRVRECEPCLLTRRRPEISDHGDAGGFHFSGGGATHKDSEAVHTGDCHRHALWDRRRGRIAVARSGCLPELAGDEYEPVRIEG